MRKYEEGLIPETPYKTLPIYYVLYTLFPETRLRCTSTRAIISPQFLIKGDNYVGVKENTKKKVKIELSDGIPESKNYSYVSKCTRLPSPRVKFSIVVSVRSGPN